MLDYQLSHMHCTNGKADKRGKCVGEDMNGTLYFLLNLSIKLKHEVY
jgi:hypothetical protein